MRLRHEPCRRWPLPFPHSLRDVPQQGRRHGRSQEGGAIAQDGDELGQVLELQPIVERVPEAMGPVKERQGDEDEEVEPYHRVRHEAVEDLVAGRLEPTQGKGEAGQEEMDRKEERGDRPPGAEQEPQERRDPFEHLFYPRSSAKATTPESTSQAA